MARFILALVCGAPLLSAASFPAAAGATDSECHPQGGPEEAADDTLSALQAHARRSRRRQASDADALAALESAPAPAPAPAMVGAEPMVWDGRSQPWVGSARSAEEDVALTLVGGPAAIGSVKLSAGPVGLLEESGVQPSGVFEEVAPMGVGKSVKVEDITGEGPLLIGQAPLPTSLRGLFWLSDQQYQSALMSFGGPSRDGGGLSPGVLNGENKSMYSIRVGGDRVWSSAEDRTTINEAVDLVYHFVFNHAENPTKCQIYADFRNLNVRLSSSTDWLLRFDMELDEGNDKYPGSVCWKRLSSILGVQVNQYDLVQVMDEAGQRIEPAWSAMAAYQRSEVAGESPGLLWYHEIP